MNKKTRLMVAAADRDGGWFCRYCGIPLANRITGEGEESRGEHIHARPGYRFPELDHVVPKSAGGSDDLNNRVLSCPPCNRRKWFRPVEEFLAERGRQ